MSCPPEVLDLIQRVGLDAAKSMIRAWINRVDREAQRRVLNPEETGPDAMTGAGAGRSDTRASGRGAGDNSPTYFS